MITRNNASVPTLLAEIVGKKTVDTQEARIPSKQMMTSRTEVTVATHMLVRVSSTRTSRLNFAEIEDYCRINIQKDLRVCCRKQIKIEREFTAVGSTFKL